METTQKLPYPFKCEAKLSTLRELTREADDGFAD